MKKVEVLQNNVKLLSNQIKINKPSPLFQRKSLLSNTNISKQGGKNLTNKPFNFNLTNFLKGNISEDYSNLAEADVITSNKTRVSFY